MQIRDLNEVSTVPADTLAPNGARTSPGTDLTAKVKTFSSMFFWLSIILSEVLLIWWNYSKRSTKSRELSLFYENWTFLTTVATSILSEQSFGCPDASKVILNEMGRSVWYLHHNRMRIVCVVFKNYCVTRHAFKSKRPRGAYMHLSRRPQCVNGTIQMHGNPSPPIQTGSCSYIPSSF